MGSDVLYESKESFSEKDRLKETLRSKNLEAIKTKNINTDPSNLPTTPSSVTATPRELYGLDPKHSLLPSPPWTGKALSPISPPGPKHIPLPPTPITPGFSLKPVPARPRPRTSTIYVPGPIELLDRMEMLSPRMSIATMDHFHSEITPMGKRFSDMVTLDAIVMFFQDLGVVEESAEDELDRYWICEPTASEDTKATPEVKRTASLRASIRSNRHSLLRPLSFVGAPLPVVTEGATGVSPETPGPRKVGFKKFLKPSRLR